MRTILNIEPYSLLKPTKVGFIFNGPNSLSRAKDIAAVNHVTQAVIRVGSRLCLKVGFKELRLEPKFLNRGLWGHVNSITKFGFDRFSCLDIYWICFQTFTLYTFLTLLPAVHTR